MPDGAQCGFRVSPSTWSRESQCVLGIRSALPFDERQLGNTRRLSVATTLVGRRLDPVLDHSEEFRVESATAPKRPVTQCWVHPREF